MPSDLRERLPTSRNYARCLRLICGLDADSGPREAARTKRCQDSRWRATPQQHQIRRGLFEDPSYRAPTDRIASRYAAAGVDPVRGWR